MRRNLFTTASVVSLLLLVATLVMWIRSNDQRDEIFGTDGSRRLWWVWSATGSFRVAAVATWPNAQPFGFQSTPVADWMTWERRHISASKSTVYWEREVLGEDYESYNGSIGLNQSGAPLLRSAPWSDPDPAVRSYGVHVSLITVPYSLPASITPILPLIWLLLWGSRRIVRTVRLRSGACPACAYNLTGNTSGVCPECGTATTQEHLAISN